MSDKPTLDFRKVRFPACNRRSKTNPYRWYYVVHADTGADLLGYKLESSWDSEHIPQLVHDALCHRYTLTNVSKRLLPNPPDPLPNPTGDTNDDA